MVTEAGIIASDVDQASTVCAGANNLTPLVEQYAEAAAGLTDSLGNSADDVFSAKRTIREWGVRKKNSVIWVCFVCLLALPGVFVAGYICHSACTEKVAMMFSTLVTLSLVLLCPLIMVLLVGLADFCMDPNGNALHVMQAEEGDAVYLTVSYYLECRGANPLSDEIAQSTAATSLLSQEVHTLTDSGGDCEANADLLHVLDSIKVVDVAIDDILALFDCQPVMDQWNNMMHEGVCHDMFDGFYLIWQALYFCACFLLALCIAASLLYQYFTMDAILVDSRDDQENTAVLEIKNSHDQTLSKHDKSPSKSLELTFGEVYVERDDSLSTQAQVRYTGSYHSPRSSDASAPPESFMMV
ncbi:unnamed protein product [Symbiodinium microadriaticum]|nr:unnamed protein product [Symbiodinium microadriaticum]